MKPDPHLEEYLALCKRMYLRMKVTNDWPWEQAGSEDAAPSDEGGNDEQTV